MKRSLLGMFRFLVVGVVAISGTVNAQSAGTDYPRKSIRLVVPFAPGGPVDIVARGIAPRMSEIPGQQIVDNRGGARAIGTKQANAPDGYTLVMVSGSVLTGGQKPPYDSVTDSRI